MSGAGSVIKKQKWNYVKSISAAKAREFFGRAGTVAVRRRDEKKGLPTFAVWEGEGEPTAENEPGAGAAPENPGTWVEEAKTGAPASEPVVDVDKKDPDAN